MIIHVFVLSFLTGDKSLPMIGPRRDDSLAQVSFEEARMTLTTLTPVARLPNFQDGPSSFIAKSWHAY
jgi:hypothetical protein